MTILLAFTFTCHCGLGTYTKKYKDQNVLALVNLGIKSFSQPEETVGVESFLFTVITDITSLAPICLANGELVECTNFLPRDFKTIKCKNYKTIRGDICKL